MTAFGLVLMRRTSRCRSGCRLRVPGSRSTSCGQYFTGIYASFLPHSGVAGVSGRDMDIARDVPASSPSTMPRLRSFVGRCCLSLDETGEMSCPGWRS